MGSNRQCGPLGTCASGDQPKAQPMIGARPVLQGGARGGAHLHRMPEERPPKYAFLNLDAVLGYRPPEDQIAEWHTVAPGKRETFWSIAAQLQVPVEKFIGFNFPASVEGGRVIPAVVNWYLHRHRKFGCATTEDGLNRKFNGGERIAIPFLGSVVVGEARIGKLESLDDKSGSPWLRSEKFTYEFKIPPKPKDLGYLLAQARIAIEGEISQHEGLLKTSFKKDQIKLALEKKLDDDLKVTFGAKCDEKGMENIAEGVKSGSPAGFAKALAAPFEASLKRSFRWGHVALEPELGAEFSTTPVVVRVAGTYEDVLIVDGLNMKGKFSVKVGFNVGLSAKGWAWVVQRVGPEAIKRLISAAGRSLAGLWEYLVAEGIIVAGVIVIGTVLGTLALTGLMAWVVADARRKGELRGLATWYVSAFSAKVFLEPRPSGFIIGDTKMRDELVRVGEEDAVTAARKYLESVKHPDARASEARMLEAYRGILIQAEHGSYSTAKWRLQRALEEKSQQLVGL